ncbi:hypothetical protein HU200_034445 [Digitaria exilis]|uniref:Pentatricopeptide repeat-containing protein n=1 Tax=Digitaria exilis TaxID=1010633 RepID=A0A835ELY8_9POAL|nr:hypothetical protein HU200_034445 [Digitaria exilis]
MAKGAVVPPTVHTYAILIDGCGRARRTDLALAFFGQLLRTGLGVNTITFCNLLKGLCCAKRTDEAAEVLLCRMPELECVPDAISHFVLLRSFCDEKRSQRDLKLLHMMAQEGACCAPNGKNFNIIINAYAKSGRMGEAILIFEEMEWQGVNPDVVNYGTLIAALSRMGQLDDAMYLFSQMTDQGLLPNGPVYCCLIQGFCTHGDLAKAKELVSEMVNTGIRPDMTFFNSLINNLCKQGRVNDGQDIFDLIEHIGMCPDVIMFSALMDGYCLVGKMEEALRLLDVMLSAGIEPEVVPYGTVVHGYCKNGQIDDALNIVIAAMFEARRIEEAKSLFTSISAQGLVPSGETYRIMLTNLGKEGLLEEADHMFPSMLKSGCPPNSRLLNAMVRFSLEKGQIVKAGTYLSKIDENNLSLEASTTSLLISLFSNEGEYRENRKVLPSKYQCIGQISRI